MTDKEKDIVAFSKEMHELFVKHGKTMQEADTYLAELAFEKFKQTYSDLDKETLAEIVQAQHLKVNELYQQIINRNELIHQIMTDISRCSDLDKLDELRKRARTVLLAQNMVDRGKSPDEVKAMLNGEKSKQVFANGTKIILPQ